MKVDRLISEMGEDVEAIIAGLPAALKHLGEWSGEYPGRASGASPSTCSPDGGRRDDSVFPVFELLGVPVGSAAGSAVLRFGEAGSTGAVSAVDDVDRVVLSRFEVLALLGDEADRYRLALMGRLRHASELARAAVADVDGVELPVSPESDVEDLAVLRWAVVRLGAEPGRVVDSSLDRASRAVRVARRLVDQWQPPERKAPSGCRVHQTVGDHEAVYRSGLCRGCWEFRRLHDVVPSAEILRAWSKRIKPTPAQIEEAIAAGRKSKKRGKKRRSA